MYEFIVEFRNLKFLVSCENKSELLQNISENIHKKLGQNIPAHKLQLQQFHQRFLQYYDVDENEMPKEGVLLASAVM